MDLPNMIEDSLQSNSQSSFDRQTRDNLVLIIVYFVFRIPINYFLYVDPSSSNWTFVGIYIVFYLITSALIWKNREELNYYHIDRIFIFIFILFGSLFRYRTIDNLITLFMEILFFLFIIFYSIALIKGKFHTKSFSVLNKWNFIALISGIFLALLVLRLDPLYALDYTRNFSIILLVGTLIKNFFIEMGSSVIIEEPIYRGFLWGILKKYRWSQSKIFLFQAFLFWISHIYYLSHPFTFWVVVPAYSLLLGYLTLKSKSVIPPVITHALYNAFLVTFLAVFG
jgi:membrane protease YdiL (CAAX protease family)